MRVRELNSGIICEEKNGGRDAHVRKRMLQDTSYTIAKNRDENLREQKTEGGLIDKMVGEKGSMSGDSK